jgi:hypothetical protein
MVNTMFSIFERTSRNTTAQHAGEPAPSVQAALPVLFRYTGNRGGMDWAYIGIQIGPMN